MDGQTRIFTRRELYDLVWKTPVDLLAKQFGLSGVGLDKICERHSIPVPPRGYWTKARTGKRPVRPPLLEIDTPSCPEPAIPVTPTSPPETTPVAGSEAERYAILRQQLLAETPQLKVSATLRKPHALIARWLADDAHDRTAWSPFPRRSRYAEPLAKRRLRLLSALFKALDERGITVKHDPQVALKFHVSLKGGDVHFQIQEHHRQVRRELTADEKSLYSESHRSYRLEKQRTGELILTIQNYLPSCLKRRWQDTTDLPLESQAHELLAGIILAATYEHAQAQRRAADERARWDEQKRKWEEERQEKLELDRRAALLKIVRDWRDAGEIRAFVAALRKSVEDGEFHPNAEICEPWLNWALERAKRLDPIASGWSFRKDLFEDDRSAIEHE